MLLVSLVRKGIPGFGRVEVGFKPGPGLGTGVERPPLPMMNKRSAEAKCLSS